MITKRLVSIFAMTAFCGLLLANNTPQVQAKTVSPVSMSMSPGQGQIGWNAIGRGLKRAAKGAFVGGISGGLRGGLVGAPACPASAAAGAAAGAVVGASATVATDVWDAVFGIAIMQTAPADALD